MKPLVPIHSLQMALPLFIIGTQRSGSNLLRLMLNESPDIAAPHPPHILKVFFPLLPYYGDLAKEENFDKLVADACEFVQKNPVEWEVQPTFAEVKPMCKQATLMEVMRSIYELTAAAKDAKYWCCKSMANVEFLPQIHADLPAAKYIYLYRDGRDVALSFTKAFVGEKHVYAIAKQWAKDQELALNFQAICPPKQFFMLQYETFIENAASELQRLCQFLEIPYLESMMQYHQSKESQRTAESGEMWKNVVKPVITQNKQKFLKELNEEQISIFEKVGGVYLTKLGYELVNKNTENQGFTAEEILAFESENKERKQAIRKEVSEDELGKRAAQEALIQRIKLG